MEIYLRTDLDLDQLAKKVSNILNIAPENRSSYQLEQRRESQNKGGTYYLFEVFGVELIVLQNNGEVQIPERRGWPYYIFLNGAKSSQEFLSASTLHLADVLRGEGIEVEVDELAA